MKKEFFAVLAILALVACGGGGGEEATGAAPAPGAEAAPAAAVDPATAGTLVGTVAFEGDVPESKAIQMGADPVCAKMHPTAVTTEFVVVNDGTLQHVFVYVQEGLGGRKFSAPAEPVLLDQQGCRYFPHVFGIMVGQQLEILNSDDTLHNIHAMPEKNPQFNIGQPVKGLKTKKSFEVPEVMIPFKCDVHKWMNAYAGVLDHPYYAVTGDTGSFEIGNLPPGDYVVEAWHETLGTQTQDITVGEQETKELTFTFAALE
jgi:hypothetical protein